MVAWSENRLKAHFNNTYDPELNRTAIFATNSALVDVLQAAGESSISAHSLISGFYGAVGSLLMHGAGRRSVFKLRSTTES
jgi:hypothetical protein